MPLRASRGRWRGLPLYTSTGRAVPGQAVRPAVGPHRSACRRAARPSGGSHDPARRRSVRRHPRVGLCGARAPDPPLRRAGSLQRAHDRKAGPPPLPPRGERRGLAARSHRAARPQRPRIRTRPPRGADHRRPGRQRGGHRRHIWRRRFNIARLTAPCGCRVRECGCGRDRASACGRQHNSGAVEDPSYPVALRTIADPPRTLYVRGTLRSEDRSAVAVVGARRASVASRWRVDRRIIIV